MENAQITRKAPLEEIPRKKWRKKEVCKSPSRALPEAGAGVS